MFGLTVEEASEHMRCEVWPDNVPTVNAFIAMSTQWRMGFEGAIGLDYGALPAVLKFSRVAEDAQPEVFDGIRLMENEALSQMRQRQKK